MSVMYFLLVVEKVIICSTQQLIVENLKHTGKKPVRYNIENIHSFSFLFTTSHERSESHNLTIAKTRFSTNVMTYDRIKIDESNETLLLCKLLKIYSNTKV